ncbi:NAD(P)-binding domain-containing protein, partial [Bacillus sp. SIMBA_008]|uniref:NAD(P)-binding domain-containing protein n=1 Tax=Bacillus sp. SIMBA_008 TaxID=3085757 RepID=UPI00397AD18A
RVFDLVPEALAHAVEAGAVAASSAADTLADAEVVISMLPTSRHVEGLYLGEAGLLAKIPAGALVIDCSTIAPASARKVAEAATARGLQMLDAQVSGGT